LEGALCVQVGNDEVEVRTGSGVLVPRGIPHTYWNPGPGRVRYLLVVTSNIFRLIQEIHAMTDRTPSSLQAVFRKYDSELLSNDNQTFSDHLWLHKGYRGDNRQSYSSGQHPQRRGPAASGPRTFFPAAQASFPQWHHSSGRVFG